MGAKDVDDSRMSSLNTSRLGSHKRPTRELNEQEKLRSDEIDLRCLTLCIAMLKRVNGVIASYAHIVGTLINSIAV